jgi:outer membrane protein
MNLVIPLYQSGAEWSRIRESENQAQQAKFSTMDTKDAVMENVTRAWQDYNTAKAVITSNEEAVRAAQTALDGITQENRYGTRTILDVLNTQQDMFTAQVSLVNARVNEKQVAYRLLASIGSLTAQSLNLPVDVNDPKQHYDDVKYKLIGF